MTNIDKEEQIEREKYLEQQRKDKAKELWAKVRKFVALITKGRFQETDETQLALDFTKPHLRKEAARINRDILKQVQKEKKNHDVYENRLKRQLRDAALFQ